MTDQEIMDQAVSQSLEIIRLKDINRELYEALAILTDFPDDYFEGEEDGPFTMTARLSMMRKARAALAKARG